MGSLLKVELEDLKANRNVDLKIEEKFFRLNWINTNI